MEKQRVDKWLFFTRVVKTRSLAARLANAGHVRINGEKTDSASKSVRCGDVVTITLDRRIIIYKVADCGQRRGPAKEAQLLYEDLSPPAPKRRTTTLDQLIPKREPGAGRPTKRERRALDRWTSDRNT
ncbi:MAG: RNA-binding S4 domain-containing protein [Pseudomonadota bacterium]